MNITISGVSQSIKELNSIKVRMDYTSFSDDEDDLNMCGGYVGIYRIEVDTDNAELVEAITNAFNTMSEFAERMNAASHEESFKLQKEWMTIEADSAKAVKAAVVKAMI